MAQRFDIRAVTFDVGGTLIEPFPSVGAVYADVAREFGFECSPEIITRQFGEAWALRSGFSYSRNEWFEVVQHSFRGHAEVSESLFNTVYERFCDSAAWRLFDDVLPTFRALSELGIKLAVISNWDDRLEPLLERLGIQAHFDHITVSGKLGCHKPDPHIFRHTAESLNLRPAELLHVGDSLREDIQGAQNAGLRAVRIRRKDLERPEDISTLTAIPDIIISANRNIDA